MFQLSKINSLCDCNSDSIFFFQIGHSDAHV